VVSSVHVAYARSILNARDAWTDEVHSASGEKLVAEPRIRILEHLPDRAYEHVAASVVCFATKNGATAEVAARSNGSLDEPPLHSR
jgi:hypothetical protein